MTRLARKIEYPLPNPLPREGVLKACESCVGNSSLGREVGRVLFPLGKCCTFSNTPLTPLHRGEGGTCKSNTHLLIVGRSDEMSTSPAHLFTSPKPLSTHVSRGGGNSKGFITSSSKLPASLAHFSRIEIGGCYARRKPAGYDTYEIGGLVWLA